MAYDLKKALGFGDGRLGSVSNPTSTINSYANVSAINGNTITVDMTNKAEGTVKIVAGEQVMIHVSATTGTDAQYLGLNKIANIVSINGNDITLSKYISDLIPADKIATHYIQLVTIAQYDTLNLSADISPLAYDVLKKYGGIIAIKCKTALNMNGGRIYLVDKGIPTANNNLRVLTTQEKEMTTTGNTTGWENHVTVRQLLLNVGDGVATIWTKSAVLSGTANRIGSSAAGAQYYPYSIDRNDNNPSEVLGGSTISFVSETINGFNYSLISKGKGSGKGYGRCYIATETSLAADEKLYALDCISNFSRIVKIGIKDFGNGSAGNVINPTGQINSYISVASISTDGLNYTVGTGSTGAYGGFTPNTKVIVHISASKAGATDMFGKFYMTKIISINGSVITLKDKSPFTIDLNSYYVQIITIPEFNNLTINYAYTGALAWNDTSKIGGLCVISCKGTLDLTNGSVNMFKKGLPESTTTRPAIVTQCSGQQKDYLPISQGNGAVLLLSNIINLNNSAIGYEYPYGAGYSAVGGDDVNNDHSSGGGGGAGYGGSGPIYIIGNIASSGSIFIGGDSQGRTGAKSPGLNGGSFIHPAGYYGYGGKGGASLFIVANTMNNFKIAPICTGGGGGAWDSGYTGGGGGAGTCFIYCNKTITPDYTAVVLN